MPIWNNSGIILEYAFLFWELLIPELLFCNYSGIAIRIE
jgi:hypothetical protein